jgi:hypothetical protein
MIGRVAIETRRKTLFCNGHCGDRRLGGGRCHVGFEMDDSIAKAFAAKSAESLMEMTPLAEAT